MDLLTTEQAAEYLKVARSTLRKWRSQGRGPSFRKLGDRRTGGTRYLRSDLDDYIGPRRNSIPTKQAA